MDTDTALSPQAIGWFFAYAPMVLGLLIFLTTFFAKRGEDGRAVPIGQTFACAGCGRRGIREHMLPVTHEGAVSWYCSRCAAH